MERKVSIASGELPVNSPGVGLKGIRLTLKASCGFRTSLRTTAWSGSSLTPASIRRANHFTFHPIAEVAAIFFGIFATVPPALDLLRTSGDALGVREPWQYFWAAGSLSSVLDNAPTYLAFLALAQGQGLAPEVVGVSHDVLAAISLGAVFMGANTYIGNVPNFMVRSIAESRGIRMPSVGGYLLYTSAVLIPVFLLVTVLFFR